MRNVVRCFASSCLVVLAFGCDEQSSAPTAGYPPDAAPLVPGAGEPVVAEPSRPGSVEPWRFGSDSFAGAAAPGAGGQPSEPKPIVAPFGMSTACGDAIVGDDEECDDGDDGSDACTGACQTRDGGVVTWAASAAADRRQGAGRHPIAGLDAGFISTYVSVADAEPAVGATVFNIWGQRAHVVEVSAGAFPIDEANPVAAALPDGRYAVAWSDFDGDGSDLGVALREVRADGSLGALLTANAGRELSQLNPDMLWTGTELVVAWEDRADAVNGPDLRYRRFDAGLNPLSDDLALADTPLPEAAVALAKAGSGFIAAWREGKPDGGEDIVVRAAHRTFRVGPIRGGAIDDRPALVALDATHVLVAFSTTTDADVSRLRYALIDTDGPIRLTPAALNPLDDVYSSALDVAQSAPAVAAVPGGAYLSWTSEARSGDAAGDQIWLKFIRWEPSLPSPLTLSEAEVLGPRTCENSIGDQRAPALADVALPPSGALAVAWDDYSHSLSQGDPDVVVHYAPTHGFSTNGAKAFTEDFRGNDGAPWSSRWTSLVPAGVATPHSTLAANEGRVSWVSGVADAINYVNNHRALDVEMVAKVRFNLNSARGGFVARLTDEANPSYIAVRAGTQINDTWKIFAKIDGTQIDIKTGRVMSLNSYAALFTNWAQRLDFLMRFRLTTNPDNSLHVAFKIWLADLQEPAAWEMEGDTADSRIINKLGNTPGRFGLYAYNNQAGRTTTFDDFRATFYEAALHGDPTLPARRSPLDRGRVDYRTCTPENPCSLAEGCCFDDGECQAGTTCQAQQAELFGLGSHARTCSVAHCNNKRLDADETRVDCGGADCVPCQCQATTALGAASYCTTTSGCVCGIGEGDCNFDYQCLPGLVCRGGGYRFGLGAVDVCRPFHCLNRIQDAEAGETGADCGGDCGSCDCDPSNGSSFHCQVNCPCPSGHGWCSYNDECQAGTICGSAATGARFGLPVGVQTCVKPHCNDGQKNADEAGVDCGGADCGTCP